jgi:hypothetical protein
LDQTGTDGVRIGIVCPDPDIEIVAVVTDIGDGFLGRFGSLSRFILGEFIDHDGTGPELVVELAVDLGRGAGLRGHYEIVGGINVIVVFIPSQRE